MPRLLEPGARVVRQDAAAEKLPRREQRGQVCEASKIGRAEATYVMRSDAGTLKTLPASALRRERSDAKGGA